MTGTGALIGLVTVVSALALVLLLAFVTLKLLRQAPGMTGASGSPGAFEVRLMASSRKPSMPLSSHHRIIL